MTRAEERALACEAARNRHAESIGGGGHVVNLDRQTNFGFDSCPHPLCAGVRAPLEEEASNRATLLDRAGEWQSIKDLLADHAVAGMTVYAQVETLIKALPAPPSEGKAR